MWLRSQTLPWLCFLDWQIFAVLPLRMLINIDSMPAEPSSFDRVYVLVVAFLGGMCAQVRMCALAVVIWTC